MAPVTVRSHQLLSRQPTSWRQAIDGDRDEKEEIDLEAGRSHFALATHEGKDQARRERQSRKWQHPVRKGRLYSQCPHCR